MIKKIKHYVEKNEFASKWSDYANLDSNGYFTSETPVKTIKERLKNEKEYIEKKIKKLKKRYVEADRMEKRTEEFLKQEPKGGLS